MNLKRLVAYGGIILVSGGCATDRVVAAVPETTLPSPMEDVLAGRVSAMRLTTPAAQPGGSTVVICRLGGTRLSHPPLFVVDGRRLTEAELTRTTAPEDIANISILKGPAAVERYGPPAAEGVVLITLKH